MKLQNSSKHHWENQWIWYQRALIGQWLLLAVANSLPDIPPTSSGNQTLPLIAGWIKHELYLQGGPQQWNWQQSKTDRHAPNSYQPLPCPRPYVKSLVEFDFVLSSSENLKTFISAGSYFCRLLEFSLLFVPLGHFFFFCCSLHFGDMRAGDMCVCLALRKGKSPLLPPRTKRSQLFCFDQRFPFRRFTKGSFHKQHGRWGTLTKNFQIRRFFFCGRINYTDLIPFCDLTPRNPLFCLLRWHHCKSH